MLAGKRIQDNIFSLVVCSPPKKKKVVIFIEKNFMKEYLFHVLNAGWLHISKVEM